MKPAPRAQARAEPLTALLEQPLVDEGRVLEAFVAGLSTGEATPELFARLHLIADAQERSANLSFAYERLARDPRVKILPKPKQVEFLRAATRLFADVLGDPEGAVEFALRARELAPDDPQVFVELEELLADSQQSKRLAQLYAAEANRKKEHSEKLRLTRAAVELYESIGGAPDEVIPLFKRLLELEPGDHHARDTLEKVYVAGRRFRDLSDLLEQALTREPPPPPAQADELRLRLISLYRGELRDPTRAAPHLEVLLAREPIGAAALQAAEALVENRTVTARIAPLLSQAYRRLGRFEDEASTLSLELRLARAPRLAEVQERLATLRQDFLGDPAGALELLEPLVARDPANEELRARYLAVSRTFHREFDAAKLLSRAFPLVKHWPARRKLGLELSGIYAAHGDLRRARAAIEPLAVDAPDEAERLPIALRLVDLYPDESDAKGLATALAHVVRAEPELAARVVAAKRLADLCERKVSDPALEIVAFRALLGSPRHDEALDRLEALYAARGDDAGTAEVLMHRAAREPDREAANELAFRATALRAAIAPDRSVAIEVWRELIRARGPSRRAVERLIPLLEQEKDPEALAHALEASLDYATPGESAATLARLAKVRLLDLSDARGALAAVGNALALDPKEPAARKLAEKLLAEGQHRLAAAALLEGPYRDEPNVAGLVRVLSTRAELAPDSSTRFASLEEAFRLAEEKLKDPRRALELSGKALALALREQRAVLGEWLERFRGVAGGGGDPALRAELLAAAIGDAPLDPLVAPVAKDAAEALVTASELGRAIETYRKLLAHEPSSVEYLRRIDELLAEQGDPEARLSLHVSALERETDEVRRRELLRAMARLQTKELGDLPGAVATLRRLAESAPTDFTTHEALVDLYSATGDRAGLLAELLRAIEFSTDDQRVAIERRLAVEYAEGGEVERAVGIYRALARRDLLSREELDRAAALAERAGDGAALADILERTLDVVAGDVEQATLLERLAAALEASGAEPERVTNTYRRAALLARSLEGAEELSRRLAERVLASDPDDREAARFLVESAARSGQWDRVPVLFRAIAQGEPTQDTIDVLLALEEPALSAGAVESWVEMFDSVRGNYPPDSARRGRALMAARARALAALPERRREAALLFREVVSIFRESSDVVAFQRLLEAGGADPAGFEDRRWLFAFRASHDAEPPAVLLEWAAAEEHVMGDPAAAVRVYHDVLAIDPSHRAAREALIRLELALGNAAALLAALRELRERAPSADAGDIDLRIAVLLAELLGRPQEAIEVVSGLLDRMPVNPEIVRVGRVALKDGASRARAAEVLSRVAAASEGEQAEELLTALLEETRGDDSLGAARAAWSLRIVELAAKDPARALAVAVAAAEASPAESTLWDAAERFARRAGDPRIVADSYARVLSGPLDAPLAEAIGRRFVELHEEWFDEPEEVLRRLERVLVLSPRARWALDRIKLAYNAEGRWEDLFALYDRAIAGAPDDTEREDLLDEAAVAAKDLANDAERAIAYLERRHGLRPDARIEGMLERLYERTGASGKLLGLLQKRTTTAAAHELVRLQLRMARLHLDLTEPRAAFALLKQVIATHPGSADAHALLERVLRVPDGESPNDVAGAPSPESGERERATEPGAADFRAEAVHILETRYRKAGDIQGLSRVLEAAAEIARTDEERTARLEQLVSLYDGEVNDAEKAFDRLAVLLAADPGSLSHRRRLEKVSDAIGASTRRAALLEAVADQARDVPTQVSVLREAASVYERLGEPSRAASLYQRALDRGGVDARTTLEIVRSLAALFAALGRPAERCAALERVVELEEPGPARGEALRTLSRVAFEELRDGARAARAYRLQLADAPDDVDALSGLASVLQATGEWAELVQVLGRRAALSQPEAARADLVRMARLLEDQLGDPKHAIATWLEVRRAFGHTEESFGALSALLERQGQYAELSALIEEAAARLEGEAQRDAYRRLGDVRRDRTQDWVGAVEAYAAAHDLTRALTVLERVASDPALPAVATALFTHAVAAWRRAPADAALDAPDAAHAAARALMLRRGQERQFEQVVSVALRAAELPFSADRRRRFLRDAASVASDELGDDARAIALYAQLFAESPGDDVAQEAGARYVRLLENAGRHDDVAWFWEGQAKWRAEAQDRAGAAALYARAGDVWETRARNLDRAIFAHREGAALGGEASLVALARIHLAQKDYYEAAAVLEWLVAQSSRDELEGRALKLAEAHLAVGNWEQARARLERAALIATYPAKVRERLAELYRKYGEWEALTRLLVSESEQKTDDRARVALLVQAANLCSVERGEPALAVPLLERAVEIDPEDASLHLALAAAMQAAARFDDARAVLRAQVERYGHRRPKDRALVHFHLARVSLAAGHRAEALADLDIGAKINPAHPGILHELARLSLEEGQLARAERTYRALLLVQRKPEASLDEVPGRAEIYLDLSEIAARQGESDRAAELVESAFEAALESDADAASLERALRKSGRQELLARAVEARLAGAREPAAAARALSDLVALHAAERAADSELAPRLEREAARIHDALEASGEAEPTAWEALTRVYAWLGDDVARGRALERHVDAILRSEGPADTDPILALASLRLLDPARRDEGVALAEAALDRGADVDRTFDLLQGVSHGAAPHPGVLRLLERLARGPGRERELVKVVTLSVAAGPVPRHLLQQAVELARSFGDRQSEIAILRGSLSHETAPESGDFGVWPRERLARLLLEEGETAQAVDWLERASRYAEPTMSRRLLLEVGRLAATSLSDLKRAAAVYRDVLERDPADREAWEPLLDVYRKSGDHERLIALIESTAPFAPSGADRCRLRLEEATLMLSSPGREKQAIAVLNEIIAEDPKMSEAVELLENTLIRLGRSEELVELASAQLDVARSRADARTSEALSLKLARFFEKSGDLPRALEAYAAVLDWNPDNREALRAVSRLEEAVGASPADVADAIERLLAVEDAALVPGLAHRLAELRNEQADALGVERALEIGYAANPSDTALREELVARCLERGDWGRAARILRRAVEADPSDVALALRTVEAFEHASEIDLGVETLGVVLGDGAGDPELHIERARLLARLGQHDLALEDIEKAHAGGGARASDLVAALEAAIERSEGAKRVRHTLRLVELLEEMGETTQAREHLVRLGKREPRHREALRRLASLAAAEARWEEAAATYRRLIGLETGEALVATAMNLADTCEHSGHLADARGGLERALEAVPDSVELRNRLKQLYASTGATRELAHLLLSEARAETDVGARTSALIRAAELLLERNDDPRLAIEALEEVNRLTPESIQGAVLLARAHGALGDARAATAALHAVVQSHRGKRTRDLALVHREISHIHLEAGDLRSALDAMVKAFDLDMRNGELAMQLGHLAMDLNDSETAVRAFRSVTMMTKVRLPGTTEGTSPESKAVAYYHLGRIAQAQGDIRRARLMVSKAVAENPNHLEAQALLRDLKVG